MFIMIQIRVKIELIIIIIILDFHNKIQQILYSKNKSDLNIKNYIY